MDFCVNIITSCCLFSNYHIICSFFPKALTGFGFPRQGTSTRFPTGDVGTGRSPHHRSDNVIENTARLFFHLCDFSPYF